MGTFGQDVRIAVRELQKGILVTGLAALSLALAIGGNVTVFGLVNAILFRPLPFPEPDRLVLVGEREATAMPTLTASPANFVDWRSQSGSFTEMAGFRPKPVSLGAGERPEPLMAAEVSEGFFDLLGARPFAGRFFTREEWRRGGPAAVVIAHRFLRERISPGRDPLGETIVVNREPYTIVGVLPDDFEFFNPQVELWLPLRLDGEGLTRETRTVLGVARLRPGVTMEQARGDVENIEKRLAGEYPEANRGFVVDVLNLRYDIPDRRGRLSFALLQGAVVFVLLIACVNITNLLLARTAARRREMALRSALGASRGRLLRQLLTESILLAGVGGASGLALGIAGLHAATSNFAGVLPKYWTPVVDGKVLAFTLGLTALSGIFFGLSPAWLGLKVDVATVLKEGGRGSAGGGRKLLSRALVVAEIALSLVLLGGGSVLVRTFLNLRNGDPGFRSAGLLVVATTLPEKDGLDPVDTSERLLETSRALPGVAGATLSSAIPQNVYVSTISFRVDERPPSEGEASPRAVVVVTSPDYAKVLGVAVRSGRYLERADSATASDVAVVSESLAGRFWPQRDALGRRLTVNGRSREIVGVVADLRQSLMNQGQSYEGAIYLPFAQEPVPSFYLLVRCDVDPHGVSGALRNELSSLDSRLSIGRIETLDEFVSQFFVGIDIFNAILTGFGFLALLLAALGTYGVLAYNVTLRAKEIGVRLALGASPAGILRMVTRQGMLLGGLGLLLGVPGVWGVMRVIRTVLVHAQPVGPGNIVVVTVVLFVCTVAASYVPARRAAAMEPLSVLRDE